MAAIPIDLFHLSGEGPLYTVVSFLTIEEAARVASTSLGFLQCFYCLLADRMVGKVSYAKIAKMSDMQWKNAYLNSGADGDLFYHIHLFFGMLLKPTPYWNFYAERLWEPLLLDMIAKRHVLEDYHPVFHKNSILGTSVVKKRPEWVPPDHAIIPYFLLLLLMKTGGEEWTRGTVAGPIVEVYLPKEWEFFLGDQISKSECYWQSLLHAFRWGARTFKGELITRLRHFVLSNHIFESKMDVVKFASILDSEGISVFIGKEGMVTIHHWCKHFPDDQPAVAPILDFSPTAPPAPQEWPLQDSHWGTVTGDGDGGEWGSGSADWGQWTGRPHW